jgi:hypothetical protein
LTSGVFGDDDGIGLCERLQSRRNVWRLTYDATLLRLSRSNQLADYN